VLRAWFGSVRSVVSVVSLQPKPHNHCAHRRPLTAAGDPGTGRDGSHPRPNSPPSAPLHPMGTPAAPGQPWAMAQSPERRPLQCLLATDLSPRSLPHVAYGARLAELLGARTTLFHAAVLTPIAVGESMPGVVGAAPIEEGTLRSQLAEVAATLVVGRRLHTDLAVAASARQAILDAAARHHADFLALPTHGRSGAARALLGSVAEDVLRHAHLPTLLLTDGMLATPLPAAGLAVLAAADDGADAAALQPAADLARRLGLPLVLLAVLPARQAPPHGGGAPVVPTPSPATQRVHDRLQALRPLAAALGSDLRVEAEAVVGDDVAAAILARASAPDIGFVVLGTHARTGLARAFHGSVAESVARRCPRPVLVVPAREPAAAAAN
jgi:nucleotide-binding universal stress UspA family protein